MVQLAQVMHRNSPSQPEGPQLNGPEIWVAQARKGTMTRIFLKYKLNDIFIGLCERTLKVIQNRSSVSLAI